MLCSYPSAEHRSLQGIAKRLLMIFLLIPAALCLASPGLSSDGLFVGDQVKTFARAECTQSFLPEALEAEESVVRAWTQVRQQLETLSQKLPATSTYIRSFFENGRIIWCFVESELKEIEVGTSSELDAVSSSIILSYEKQQAAVNQDGVVRIRKDLWDAMDTDSRAAVLLVEGLWSAIGPAYIETGRQVRDVANLVLHQNLDSFVPTNVALFLKRFLGRPCAQTRMVALAEFDLRQLNNGLPFAYSLDFDDSTPKLTLTVQREASRINGYQVTQLNPDRQYRHIIAHRNGRLYNDLGGNRLSSNLHPIELRDLCSTLGLNGIAANGQGASSSPNDTLVLEFGEQPWRLPTSAELYDLYELGLLQFEFISHEQPERILSAAGHTRSNLNRSSFVYPTDSSLILLTAEGRQYDLSNQFEEATDRYQFNRQGHIDGNSNLKFTRYLCIKGVAL